MNCSGVQELPCSALPTASLNHVRPSIIPANLTCTLEAGSASAPGTTVFISDPSGLGTQTKVVLPRALGANRKRQFAKAEQKGRAGPGVETGPHALGHLLRTGLE